MKKAISTTSAPGAIGPYSQAVETDSMIVVSGQIPLKPDGETLAGKSVSEQTRLVLENMQAVLKQAGSDMQRVVKTTVFMTDLSKFGEMNEEYASFFQEPFPARAAVQVAALPKGVDVEIEAWVEK